MYQNRFISSIFIRIYSYCKLLISDARQLIVVKTQCNYEIGKTRPIIKIIVIENAIDQKILTGIVKR